MKSITSRALFAALLLAGSGSSNLSADDDPYFRYGLDIPVEGTVRPVRVGDVAWPENFRPVDAEGWSTFLASPETRILYVSSSDGNGGNIANNLLVRQHHPDIGNAYGIQMQASQRQQDRETGKPITQGRGSLLGRTRNVNIFRNVVYGIRMSERNAPLKLLANSEGGFENVRVFDNHFQCQVYPNPLAIVESLDGVAFENNTWYTIAEGKPFQVGSGDARRELAWDEWLGVSGERGGRFRKVDYPDADRSIENYMRRLGYRGTDEELYARFFEEACTMRRGAWRREFTASAINDYFREGFGMQHLPLDELPPVQCGPFHPEFSYRENLADRE